MRLSVLPLAFLFLFACSEEKVHRIPPGIAIEAEDETELEAIDFGELPVDDQTEGLLFVRSTRATQLEVKRVEIVGKDAASFDVDDEGFKVSGRGREPLEVRFAPLAVGQLQATLVIHSDDPDRPKVEVELVGRGIDSAIRVEACLVPTDEDPELCSKTLVVAPEALDLGEVVAGTPRNARVTVTNLGRKPLELHSVVFEDPDQADAWGFTLPKRAGEGQTIGGLSSGGLVLGFHPPQDLVQEVEVALIITSSDRSQSEIRLPVMANVIPNAPPLACVRVAEAISWDGTKTVFELGERVVISPGDSLVFDARVREGCTGDPEDGEAVDLEWSIESDDRFNHEVVPDFDPFLATFQADTIGAFTLHLRVTDSIGQVATADENGIPASVEFFVEPQTDIGAEIRWSADPGVDLDVHLVRADGPDGIFGQNDFFWDNLDVRWGASPPLSNPRLAIDDKGSLMVETVLLNAPEPDQRYSILVHLQRDGRSRNGSSCSMTSPCGGGRLCSYSNEEEGICMPPVEVSARLFLLREEFEIPVPTAQLGSACEFWHVGDVIWSDPPSFVPGIPTLLKAGSVEGATCSPD